MKAGDTVQVDVPETIAYPLSVFDGSWIAWATALDSKKVVLHAADIMATPQGDEVEGFYIDIKAPGQVSSWLPTIWLREFRVGGYCNACGGFGKHRLGCPAGVPGDTII